jgi:hypothetical protein
MIMLYDTKIVFSGCELEMIDRRTQGQALLEGRSAHYGAIHLRVEG